GDDMHGSSNQEPDLVETTPWGVKERLTLEKTAIGFYLSGHLFDEVAREVRQFARRQIDELLDSREPQVIAGIVSGLRVINGNRGRLAIFVLDDKTDTIEAVADEAVFDAARNQLKEDELVIVSGRLQPGRGGFEARFNVQQVWDLATARCRFGKFLRVAVNGKLPDIARIVRDFPPRKESTEHGEVQQGLGVRLAMARSGAQVELQLGEAARFFPVDAALASWMAQAEAGKAAIVYE
ncbi:MAG: DNA polymerase III subunit alpha, partial [Proteobacteria bacterium]|nr:DNA polymerase III subunit alpha [Pseudomonadota bacterium]